MCRKTWAVLILIATMVLAGAGSVAAHPEDPGHVPGTACDPADGPCESGDGHQHGTPGGHLPASSHNVDLVGKVELTNVAGGIADVSAFGNYAYLNAFSPECTGRPGAQGTGVHIVDISNSANPTKVGFIPAHSNSFVGEGIHVIHAETPFFTGDILIHNNETCDSSRFAPSGVSLWNVTDPLNPQPLALNAGDSTPSIALQTYHTTHSAQGFTTPGHAYVVMQDNQEFKDVDILDITDPYHPLVVAEVGLEDWPAAQSPLANGDTVFHHDMQVNEIDGHRYLLVSYWDAGWVLLNIDNPANPSFVKDSDYPTPDPLTGFQLPEGNGHQAYWSSNDKFILGTDEDFSPFRTAFQITSGQNAGPYGAGEFGWTVPIATKFPGGLSGSTIWGGSGCVEDLNGNSISDRNEVPPAPTPDSIVVFTRGTCFFSIKVESGQLAGYGAVIIGNSHGGSRGGLVPDAFLCGGQGHVFTITASAICIGHRAMHLLFNDAPEYAGPEGADVPPIGTLGAAVSASTQFDGWGYVHLLDANTLQEIDAYAVPESLDPAFASGFGNLTVHEVKTDPRHNVNLAYLSYYDAGLRVVKFGKNGIHEVGHYIAEDGNDFWGTFPHQLKVNQSGNGGQPLLLMSDRDSGLWIFRYTGD